MIDRIIKGSERIDLMKLFKQKVLLIDQYLSHLFFFDNARQRQKKKELKISQIMWPFQDICLYLIF